MSIVLAVAAAFAGVAGALTTWVKRRMVLVTVQGTSMEPTLHDGDRVIARCVPAGAVRTGQLVVFQRPPHSYPDAEKFDPSWAAGPAVGRDWLIKRVVAVAGDPLPAMLRDRAALLGAQVPVGRVLVLGDNPGRSYDSRRFGYVDLGSTARVVIGLRACVAPAVQQ